MRSLVAIVTLFAMTALPAVASARPHRGHRHHHRHQVQVRYDPPPSAYGAISRSARTGRIGWSYGYSSLGEAQLAATNSCGESDCLVVAWEQNRCAALVEGAGAWGSASGVNVADAEARALDACAAEGGYGCRLVRWVCH